MLSSPPSSFFSWYTAYAASKFLVHITSPRSNFASPPAVISLFAPAKVSSESTALISCTSLFSTIPAFASFSLEKLIRTAPLISFSAIFSVDRSNPKIAFVAETVRSAGIFNVILPPVSPPISNPLLNCRLISFSPLFRFSVIFVRSFAPDGMTTDFPIFSGKVRITSLVKSAGIMISPSFAPTVLTVTTLAR